MATKRDADGWSAEIRIPFKTLRFERGADRIWGVNFSRRIRRKNEIDYWSPVPRVYNLYRAGLAGTLTGLPDASQGRNLRIKPWIAADATRRSAAPSFDAGAHAGLDLKYGVTPSLTLDVTVKPDFAQAEADEQQVNLTQFSLYYPGEARVLPRELRHVLLRRHPARVAAGEQPLRGARRRDAAVLQPPHRPDQRRRARFRSTPARG